ncbi:radical SAM protein [Chloroflexota bacterium]
MNNGEPSYPDPRTEHFRSAALDASKKRVLIANLLGSDQEKDLTLPPNCNGFGRIRHFRRHISDGWPEDPLPIDPANKALGLPPTDIIKAQAFQIASCNWRCWYCFVPSELLSATTTHAAWLDSRELIDLYLKEPFQSPIIDLTGGNPELVPEWVLWMVSELIKRKLDKRVYLWSDDNLSTDYFWRVLSENNRETIATYANYGRVCCFKGFSKESFMFNTRTEEAFFDRQFYLMSRLINSGIDVYAYATFTTPARNHIKDDICSFLDRLQSLRENLPLRMIPLKIRAFTPTLKRMTGSVYEEALINQQVAVEAWQKELENRFSRAVRMENIADVTLNSK